jgi:hypothetical protein
MLTIVQNPNGFHLINILPNGIKFNTSHYVTLRYVTDILVPLLEWPKTQVGGSDRKLIIHAHNARPHTSRVTLEFVKQNPMKRAPHPPCSPDLAPSDFYLLSSRRHQETLGRTRIPWSGNISRRNQTHSRGYCKNCLGSGFSSLDRESRAMY